jgi:YbbR domain-containing protein
LIGDQTVSVQIDVVPIQDSRPISFRQVEVVGLSPGLQAQLSPSTVDVILAGPLAVLNSLEPFNVHIRIDLTGRIAGTYQLTPIVIVPEGVTVQSILPGTVEVTISKWTGATATFTPTTSPTITLTFTPIPTLIPTSAP